MSENTDLVLAQDEELRQLMNEYGAGAIDNISAEDLVIPRYRIIQNTSRVGTPGKWVSNTDADNELDFLDMVVVAISKYRVYFPEAGKGDRPLCKSNDGVHKSDSSGIGDGTCANCRYGQWGAKDPASGKATPPVCREGYTFTGYVLCEDGSTTPAMVSFKGSAMRPVKTFLTRMFKRQIPTFAYVVRISALSEVNDKGRYFRPSFDFGEDLSLDDAKSFAIQSQSLKQYISSDILIDVDDDVVTSSNPSAGQDFMDSLATDHTPSVTEDDIPF